MSILFGQREFGRAVANLFAVSFGADSVRGAPTGGTPAGQVDYRLARNAVLSEFRKKRLSRQELCDAHPELLRAARNVGARRDDECPICEGDDLRSVSYVFGSRLPPQGRCISSGSELLKLSQRPTVLTCYVVEVCPDCSWNHLARSFPVGGRHRTAR
jgi:hypothetical protein